MHSSPNWHLPWTEYPTSHEACFSCGRAQAGHEGNHSTMAQSSQGDVIFGDVSQGDERLEEAQRSPKNSQQ